MGEEKIFKDLTKKYAELAKKIHSKDKRSSSLIKSCSKRIVLLDKLRVLEVSYLKCLKNKVKRGQKGGAEGDEEDEERKQQEAAGIINKALDEADTTNDEEQDDGTQLNDKHQRALDVCTKALVKTIDLKEKAKEFIEKNREAILKAYENINIEQEKTILRNESIKLAKLASATLKDKTGIDVNDALADAYNKGIGLSDRFKTSVLPALNKGVNGLYNRGLNFGTSAYTNLKTSVASATAPTTPTTGGSKKTTYRLNGEKVVLLYKNKKVQRSIYVKGNGKTKYCKIDHQYILLSKLKNKIQ